MGSNKRDRKRRPARGRSSKNPRRRLLVVCEGKVTEPTYINGFVRITRNATVAVKIHGEHGDPRKLVEMAKEEKKRAEAEASRQEDDFLAYDEVWCAFDRDQHERFHDACEMARANQLELAASVPCIELWLLLHFRDSPGARHRLDVRKLLKKFLPGYDKHFDFKDVAGRVDQAIERARRLDQESERLGEPFRNPTTGFYRLIESIARNEPPVPVPGAARARIKRHSSTHG
jgi:hypothetical protein